MKIAIVVLTVVAAASASAVLPVIGSSLGVAPGLTSIVGPSLAPAISIAPLGTLGSLSPLGSSIAVSTPIIKTGIIGAPAIAPLGLGLGLDTLSSPALIELWKKKRAH
ncbi:unnamed protein product [Hermetia illucens]|uniref:Uncharacterized protein n=1 Tax=Hermetia illucens TaxID=343691 RepID=A0A7R8YPL2_HERIL|nr:uncharacterized protein LOC119649223 [Hermetia illucens]CAD7080856.1 unnamed protein product [Hermetia illucens]